VIACKRCGRPLRSEISIENGMGMTCKKKQAAADAEFEKIQMNIFDVLGSQDEGGQISGKTSVQAENDSAKGQPCQPGYAAAEQYQQNKRNIRYCRVSIRSRSAYANEGRQRFILTINVKK